MHARRKWNMHIFAHTLTRERHANSFYTRMFAKKILTPLTATFDPRVLHPRRSAVHHRGVQSHRALRSERRATASQHARTLPGHRFRQARIANDVTERVAGDDHVPREVDDLRAPERRRSVSAAAAVGRHERRVVAVPRRLVEEQRAVRFDPDDCEDLPVSRRPRLGGSDADPIPDPPLSIRFVGRRHGDGIWYTCEQVRAIPNSAQSPWVLRMPRPGQRRTKRT